MEGQGKRLLLAVALALGVMLVWQQLFPAAPAKKPPPAAAGSAADPAAPASASPYYQPSPPDVAAAADPAASSGAAGGSAAGGSAAGGSAAAPVERSADGAAMIPVPSDSQAQYYVVDKRGEAKKPILTTRRVGPAGTSFARREFDCVAQSWRYLAEGETLESLRVGKAAEGMTAVDAGSIADALWQYACGTPGAPAITPVVATAPRAPEVTKVFTFDTLRVVTTSHGGAVKSWTMLEPKYQRDHYKGEMVPAEGGGAMLVYFPGSTFAIPPDADWTASEVIEGDEPSITYAWESPEMRVVKTFRILPRDHVLKTKISVTPRATGRQTLAITAFGFQDPKASTEHARGNTEWKAACLDDEVRVAGIKQLLDRAQMENGVRWAGYTQGYVPGSRFTSAQAGQFLVATAPWRNTPNDLFACNAYADPTRPGVFQVDLVFPMADFKAGDPPLVRELVTYLGPTSYDMLEAVDAKAGFSTGFNEVPDFGWFGVIGRPLLWLLHKFQGVVGNWGLAIVLLTIFVKLLTLYFTTRSMRSMKAMAALAPKMKELQEKHKDDRQKLQQATMAMYRQHNINPLAGCLPILLQMPIWIALYRMLSSAGELYLEPLIPGWISDLTSPDPFHILPVVLILAMFGQAKLQPKTTTGMQQKILMYGLPLMFGVASFFFPSGLSLYIVTNTILSAGHSIYMNKFDKKGSAMLSKIATGPKPGGGTGKQDPAGKGEARSTSSSRAGAARPIIDVEDKSELDGDDGDDGNDGDDGDPGDDGAGVSEDDSDAKVASAAGPGAAPGAQAHRSRRQSRSRRKRRVRN